MAHSYEPVDLRGLKTFSVLKRAHKVDVQHFAGLPEPGGTASALIASLPDFLGAVRFRRSVEAMVAAHQASRPVVWALGAHVIKVGCSPIVIDLIRRGVVTAVALSGATAIHDVEVATIGATSEEVAETLKDGSFGMVEETPALFAEASKLATAERRGLGFALGKLLTTLEANYAEYSILAEAYLAEIPATVHVAVGTDTVHMHANANGAQIGQTSLVDFRLICSVVADMAPAASEEASGVWANIGSAVLLPEVFLKAVAVARNLGADLDDITTINLDMIRHYRTTQNVISRPVREGRGLDLTGHHEIMLPLIRQAIIEKTQNPNKTEEKHKTDSRTELQDDLERPL